MSFILGRLTVGPSIFSFAALAIITVVAGAVPPTTLLNGKLQYGVPWFSLSVSLNIIITSIICFRLLQMRALMRETHSLNMSKMYASIAAMLVESAAVFSILGIVLIVMAVRNDPLTFAFAHVWSMFSVESHVLPLLKANLNHFSRLLQSLSPQMIILRVSMGSSWHEETVNEISTTFVPARPATFPEGSQGVCMTTSSTCSSEDPVYGPRTPLVDSSDMLTKEHMGTGDVAC
jgi:hypothetical protein